jgi:trans-aconitate 3-methyltransferase
MASAAETQRKPPAADSTFRNYDSAQAKLYAKHRLAYPAILIEKVMEWHTSTSPDPENALTTLVDVGCGPGTATFQLAPFFNTAIGLDPGESMIDTARSLSGITKSGAPVEFAISSAERIDEALALAGLWDCKSPSVDLITAATAAHWFDMPLFYAAAAKVLKPGGSIILWCPGSVVIDRRKYSAGVADQFQEIMDRFEMETLQPYEMPGNRLCRELYEDIIKPWDVDEKEAKELGLDCFKKEDYVRKTWNEGGRIEPDLEGGWMRYEKMPWTIIKPMIGTASSVTRFRAANKEKIENGEMEDCVDALLKELRAVLGEDITVFEGGTSTGALMFKKSF